MLTRRVLLAFCLTMLVSTAALSQQPDEPQPKPAPQPQAATPPPAPAPVPQGTPAPAATWTPPAPRRFGQPVAVRIEVTVSDQGGGTTPAQRTMTMLAADGERASVRSTNMSPRNTAAQFNIDAKPMLADGKIRIDLNIEYNAPGAATGDAEKQSAVVVTRLSESMGVIVENGKSTVISQSADPMTDRKVTVEVKATIVK